MRAALEDDRWTVLDTVRTARPPGAAEVLAALTDALGRDEFADPLAEAIATAYGAGVQLLAPPASQPRSSEPDATPQPSPAPSTGSGSLLGLSVEQARAKLDSLPDGTTIDLSWTEP